MQTKKGGWILWPVLALVLSIVFSNDVWNWACLIIFVDYVQPGWIIGTSEDSIRVQNSLINLE